MLPISLLENSAVAGGAMLLSDGAGKENSLQRTLAPQVSFVAAFVRGVTHVSQMAHSRVRLHWICLTVYRAGGPGPRAAGKMCEKTKKKSLNSAPAPPLASLACRNVAGFACGVKAR